MPSVNKVIIVGNIGRDPEIKYQQSGATICNLSVATSSKWKDKATGEMKEETEWHRVILFSRLAEVAAEYTSKGSTVYVEGRLRTRKWKDKDGVEKYSTEILGDVLQLLGGKRSDGDAPKPAAKGKPQIDDASDDIPF